MTLRHLPRRLAATLIAAVAAGVVHARADEPREPWNITAQTSRVVRGPEGGRILSFESDVVITHGALVANADHAEYLENLRRALLTGNVVMHQDSTVVHAPVCFYDRDTGVARFPSGLVIERPTGTAVADEGTWKREESTFELRRRVSAADTSGTLDADAATYDVARETFYAHGHARLVDEGSGIVVDGPDLRYERGTSSAVAAGRPTSTFLDEDAPVRVVSDEMRYDPRTNVGTAVGNVVLTREATKATSDSATFVRDEDRVVLGGAPRVLDGLSEITGDRIELITDSADHRTVRVKGSARVGSQLAKRPGATPADSARADSTQAALQTTLGAARDLAIAHEAEIRAKVPDSTATVQKAERAGIDSTSAKRMVDRGLAAAQALADSARAKGAAAAADSARAKGAAPPDSAKSAADSAKAALPAWLRTPGDKLPQENLLFGDEIAIDVVKNELARVDVVGHGRSKFFPSEKEGDLTEWNDVVGDTLHVWFTKSQVDSVTVLGKGVGEYRLPAKEDSGATPEVLKQRGKLVEYEAPEIRYDRGHQMMHLEQGGEVKYKTMTLRSGTIDFDSAKEIMIAGGTPSPVLVDTNEEIQGQTMRYQLPAQKGEIISGKTRFDKAYYQGKDIWKMGEGVLMVENAIYTTCDLDQPHYHFASHWMKIYLGDKVVAKPVVLKIRNIPVLALPFYVASLKKERHSGFLLPNIEVGVDANRGRFVRNLGYYWAPNDFLDETATFDFYPAQDRIVSYLTTRYNLRYRFDGRIALKYNRDVPNDRKDTALEMSHRQTLSDTMDLSGDASFLSSSSIYQQIDDAQRLNRDLRSNLTLSKRFPGSNRSLRVDLQRQQNLDQNSFAELLPAITFSQPSRPLVGGSGASSSEAARPGRERGLLEDLYWDLNSRAVRSQTRSATAFVEEHSGAQTNTGLRMTRNVARYLKLSPSVDGEGTWINKDRRGDDNALRATYQTAVSAGTALYGTFLRPIGPLKGFRHVIQPSASWNWAPEFPQYLFRDPADSTHALQDRFFSFGGIGGTPRKASNMSFGVSNLVQTKFSHDGHEQRVDLFTLRNGMSYDLLAKDTGRKPLSSFSSSLNILSALPVNQSWTVSHDPYTWRLLASSVTTRARLSSNMLGGGGGGGNGVTGVGPPSGDIPGESSLPPSEGEAVGSGTPALETPAKTGRSGSWAIDVSHTAQRAATGSPSSSLVLNSSWSPTNKWAVTFNTQYDLRNGQNTSQSWSVHRTIHCWELSFDRRLLGGEWQYYLRVNVTDLPDIQAERGDKFSGRTFGGSSLDSLF